MVIASRRLEEIAEIAAMCKAAAGPNSATGSPGALYVLAASAILELLAEHGEQEKIAACWHKFEGGVCLNCGLVWPFEEADE